VLWHGFTSRAESNATLALIPEQKPQGAKAMRLARTIAGISAVICVIGLTAIGQEEQTAHQAAPITQLERCKTAMPSILKNYNNAKYAVSRAGNSADAAHILGPVREAQAALDAMEQPLKACYEAMQNTQAEHQQDIKK
jgi:hypothetical protein